MSQVVTTEAREAPNSYRTVPLATIGGGGMLAPTTFGEVVSFAELMSRSQHAIPKHLRGNPGACMAVTMQALRWEMDPFAVAAKAYSVNDMIAYEAQLIAAVVHTRAPIRRRPEYEFTGAGADLRCRITCEMQDGSTKVYESPREGDIKTKNSPLWKTDPQQQLGYFSIRSWARRHAPEVLLGVYAPDELDDNRGPDNAKDVTPRSSMADRLAGARQADTGFSSANVEAEIATATTTEHTAPSPTAEAEQQSEPAELPLVPLESSAGVEEGPAQSPRVGLSSDDRELLRFYVEELDAERADFAIEEVRIRFWKGKAVEKGSAIAIAAGAITDAHRKRVNAEITIEECARLCREACR